jgi:anaerobic magnesium-protoporphyrin IX monomethyl ester cyclase
VTLADENPTTRRDVWRHLLEELAARRLPGHFFATIRATDVVRDADLLPLYRRAGVLYVLMGIESTDAAVLWRVRKGSTPEVDVRACRLLREHGIFSVLGHVVDFGEETPGSLRAARRLRRYDGDWLNVLYVTPHAWTPFGREALGRDVVEPDQGRWDYRHQVLGQRRLRPWQLFLWVKGVELWFHLRPRRLWALGRTRDGFGRRQRRGVLRHTGLVWAGEVLEFLRTAWSRRHRHRPGRPWSPRPGRLARHAAPPPVSSARRCR